MSVDRVFDRRVHFDEESRKFPIRSILARGAALRSYSWRCNINLDQGTEGACVGFGVSHEAAARPVEVKHITNTSAIALYHRAKELDDFPGEDYEGSSVLGGVKAGVEKGWYPEYRWAFGLDDTLLALALKGPVIFGLNWYDGMFEPDKNGFIHASGSLAGGHCAMGNRISLSKQAVGIHNSWGKAWGNNGECWISFKDLKKLLKQDGECCIPVKRAYGKA